MGQGGSPSVQREVFGDMRFIGSFVMVFSLVVLLVGVFAVLRLARGIARGRSIGAGDKHGNFDPPTDQKDPIAIARECYARGEIDHDELERYLGKLVKGEHPRRSFSDPPGVDQSPPRVRLARHRGCDHRFMAAFVVGSLNSSAYGFLFGQ
jgi:uncharacterized membrane protein